MGLSLLTLEEVADLIRVPANTLRYWRQAGTGPQSARIGRRVMYREEDVRAWVAAQYADVPTFNGAAPVGAA